MEYDITSIDDVLELNPKDVVKFKCENCGCETIKSVRTFQIKNRMWCTTCLKKSVKRDTSAATAAAASKSAKEKRKSTFIQKYGRESNFDKDYIKGQLQEKYGVINSYSIPEIQQKSLKTRHDKKEKKIKSIQEENLKIFGTINPTRQQRTEYTCQQKYGINNAFQLKKVIDNTIQRNKQSHIIKLNHYLTENNLTLVQELNNELTVKCNVCGHEYIIKQANNESSWLYSKCDICFPKIGGISYEEKEVVDFIKSIYSGTIIENDRKLIAPKEIDIYIPEFKFGIEYNGLYWHAGENKNRHREKWEMAQKVGIDLMQIWSTEWRDKKDILKSIIKNRLGLSIPIYARSCEIKSVPSKEARLFADTYHMQGFYAGIYIGLYYNNELVDLSIFCKSRFGGNYQWELTRHCIKSGYRIIGGLSKEIAYFRKLGNMGNIVDYCDMRLFNGKGHWGFREVGMTPPDMQYTDFNVIIPRGKYQKHKMSKIAGFKFDPSITQRDNLLANNMDFIWGVGHKVFCHD
jgi:hypothetical protein